MNEAVKTFRIIRLHDKTVVVHELLDIQLNPGREPSWNEDIRVHCSRCGYDSGVVIQLPVHCEAPTPDQNEMLEDILLLQASKHG